MKYFIWHMKYDYVSKFFRQRLTNSLAIACLGFLVLNSTCWGNFICG
jgi:hypothetical protein